MDVTEYLAFLPLLIYGIALADLFGEWKRLLEPKGLYLPYILFTIVLTEIAVYNVFVYAELVSHLSGIKYYDYMVKLLPPFLFMLTVNAFTPDKGADTKTYFDKQMPNFCVMMAVFMGTRFFYDFGESQITIIGRIVSMALTLLAGFTRKVWLTYVLVVVWFIFIFSRSGLTINL
ncbi:MAG: hypothetical protein N4A71_09065 [Carboxylicivirga sp.]|jgi:hypothetical protein|nr:hypothetical protein [Carboxylicivirga sp.]MCT4646916.1 hypothetical protein [Carboxylicivirga sp.]